MRISTDKIIVKLKAAACESAAAFCMGQKEDCFAEDQHSRVNNYNF